MNRSIIFVPICPNCHHVFEYIKINRDFRIICPECNALFDVIKYPKFDEIIHYDEKGDISFTYDQNAIY